MKLKLKLAGILLIAGAFIFTACGGSSKSGSSADGTYNGPNSSGPCTVSTIAGAAEGADGTGSASRFHSPCAITSDGTNLYVADSYNNTIRQIVISTGAVTTIAGTAGISGSADGTGAAASFYNPYGITTDGTNLYVADTNNNTIRKIVISTGVVTTLAGLAGFKGHADSTGTNASFYCPYGITTDGTNLYVTDSGNFTIRQIVISTGAVTTIAGTAGARGESDSIVGIDAEFNGPSGITTDGTNLYVADYLNNAVRKIVISTGVVTYVAGGGLSYIGSADGTGTDKVDYSVARFHYPYGITTDGTNLYVADTYNNTIRQIDISTKVVTTIAGTAGIAGSADGTGSAASFYYPYGIAAYGKNLYIADTGNDTIREMNISTEAVTTLAGTASSSADGTGAAASFLYPYGITADSTNLYVADTYNNTIRQIAASTGVVTTIAGTAGVTGSADGTGAAASFNYITAITTDGTNLYAADTYNNTIRQIVISTGVVTTIAGTAGITGSADGTGAAASFHNPYGITTDGTNLYVADTKNNTIRKIVISTGVVTAIAGIAGVTGSADGTGSAASFYNPYGVTTDGTNLYVADTNNETIRKIVISTGEVTTIAGTAAKAGFADGVGTSATFYHPEGLTIKGNSLYAADSWNNNIRKISW